MAIIKAGDTIPSGEFKYIEWSPELDDAMACGIPTTLSTDEWKGKKVVVVAIPGAFTPTCHINHLPPYLAKYEELKAKGVDAIYVVAVNDPFVMSGWGKAESFKDKASPSDNAGIQGPSDPYWQIAAISDTYGKWSAEMGLTQDLTPAGMGIRTCRYCLIIDDLKVINLEVETGRGVTVTGVDTTLSKL